RGYCVAQPGTTAEAATGDGRGSSSQKYLDDRPHWRGENGNSTPPGAAGRLPVCEGGSFQVHRGWLRRPRRGIHDSRPGGDGHRHGPRGKTGRSRGACRTGGRRKAARSAAATIATPSRRRALVGGGGKHATRNG